MKTNLLASSDKKIWLLAGASLLLFALLLAIAGGLPLSTYLLVVLIAAISAAAAAIVAHLGNREAGEAKSGAPQLLNRITAGDLNVRGAEIDAAAGSTDMAASLRALVLTLERTISRFRQLGTDVSGVSQQVSRRARSLAQSAQSQLDATETTSRSVNQIDQSINRVQSNMESLSLSAEETSASILEMSASIEEVSRIADTLSEFVEQTASAIEEMISSINEVAQNTESFSSFATQTASSMVQMNATTQEIGKSAKNASDFARYVMEAANEGREAVGGTVDGMQKIQHAVDEAKNALSELGDRSQEIGEIVRVIDEIAGQTNLLALNAAIIAAQAGDRGKGFAVVADEIRDLSERTSVSTEEIRTLILNVQKSVDRAVEQMTLSSNRVQSGVDLTARAHQVLEKILDLTEKSTQSISGIAKATAEQIRGSEAATAAIEEVTKMVQQTAVATQEQSHTSRKIGEQAATVRDYTKHLKRAMQEQETGSQAISRAMESIMASVSEVLESTSVLGTESSAIVSAMSNIEKASRETNFTISDLNQMANTLSHESSLLSQEIQRFHLPIANEGGVVTTASVLPSELSLDPAYCQFMALNYLQKPIHETLVQFGEGAELVPGLAERWEVQEQGLLYIFHLRPGLKFHNGRTIGARDVRDSFLRILDPAVDSPGRWIFAMVVGADDFNEGKANDVEGFKVVDELTLEIRLREPLAFFLLLLSMPEASIVPIEEARNRDRYRLSGVGAGAFITEEVREGEMLRLRRNRGYYDPNIPHIDELRFRLDLKSSRDVTDAFFRGELDIAHGVPLSVVDQVRNDPRYAPYLLDVIQLHTSYLSYDCSTAPFDRVEVRQAVNHAIDRQRINDEIFSGLGVLADSLLPPGMIGYDDSLRGYEYDPEKARRLLRQAGYADGFSVDYWRWETDEFYNSGIVPRIIEDLSAVGIRVNVSLHSASEVRDHRARPKHNTLFAGNWYADFPDSDNFFFIFFHSDSQSLPGMNYRRGELDATIEEARRTNDNQRRAEIYRDLNEMTLREAPMVYLFHDRLFVLYKPSVRGLRTYLVPPPVRYHNVWIE